MFSEIKREIVFDQMQYFDKNLNPGKMQGDKSMNDIILSFRSKVKEALYEDKNSRVAPQQLSQLCKIVILASN